MSAHPNDNDAPAAGSDEDPAEASPAFDANAHRESSLAGWEAAAPGWTRQQKAIRGFGAPVSAWMLDAVALQPGQRVLELAAGLGETGMLAAELVAPMGGVIVSDQADGMLDGARARALELGLSNIEYQVIGAEWIDLPLASVDAVLCRWGYMLLADPPAALAETRRVLRPGGRVALAVWDSVQHNPWALAPSMELLERGLASPPAPGTPGPFVLGDPERVRELLAQAGFAEIDVQALEIEQRHPSFDAFWETTLDISHTFHNAVLSRPEPEIAQIRAGLAARLEPFGEPDGTLALPGRTLVASASA
ncbi:MAG TPA: methyltransferase domain-containing protein [Solirubrobacteraceae bacterium]